MAAKATLKSDAGAVQVGPFDSLPALVALWPRLPRRAQVLAQLTQGRAYAFVSLEGVGGQLSAFLTRVVEQVCEQDADFGKRTLEALSRDGLRQRVLLDAFVSDLGDAGRRWEALVLDAFDSVLWDGEVAAFMRQLAERLQGKPKLVLNGRYLSDALWRPLVEAGRGVVVGAELVPGDPILDGGGSRPQLEVYALSGGQVLSNGMPIDTWDGPLVRNLFYYLLDHPLVTRDEIFETFWPGITVKEATNVYHVTKRKVNERLGCELTAYVGGFYRPSEEVVVHYDAREFESLVERARMLEVQEAVPLWMEAVRYYRTGFLRHLDVPWIVERREQLQQLYVEVLVGLARYRETTGEAELAASFYLRALREVPLREDLHRAIMHLYVTQGLPKKAAAQYKMLATMLNRSLNIEPSRETQALYNQVTEKTR
jgi:hypothetical protein